MMIMDDCPGYCGSINTKQTLDILEGCEPGTYLIRNSQSRAGEFILSMQNGQIVIHYQIKKQDKNYFIKLESMFASVQKLVEHYSHGGLRMKLGKPYTALLDGKISEKLVFKEQIGTGFFGEVYKGMWYNEGKSINVAIKAMKQEQISEENLKNFQDELKTMEKLKHHNLLTFYAQVCHRNIIYIISELMINGSLLDFLKRNIGTFRKITLIKFAIEVANGMTYLESQKYVHRDLAARNILVGGRYQIKIADFGLSRNINMRDGVYRMNCKSNNPIRWSAPEVLRKCHYSIKSDIWSFGILLTEIITFGCRPYKHIDDLREVERMVLKGYRMPISDTCPEKLYEIMRDCWNENEGDRPSFGEVHQSLIREFM